MMNGLLLRTFLPFLLPTALNALDSRHFRHDLCDLISTMAFFKQNGTLKAMLDDLWPLEAHTLA